MNQERHVGDGVIICTSEQDTDTEHLGNSKLLRPKSLMSSLPCRSFPIPRMTTATFHTEQRLPRHLILRSLLLLLPHRRLRAPAPSQLQSFQGLRFSLDRLGRRRRSDPLAPQQDGVEELAAELLCDTVVGHLVIIGACISVWLVVDFHCQIMAMRDCYSDT